MMITERTWKYDSTLLHPEDPKPHPAACTCHGLLSHAWCEECKEWFPNAYQAQCKIDEAADKWTFME